MIGRGNVTLHPVGVHCDRSITDKLRGLLKRDKKIGSAVCVGDFVEISKLKDKSGVIEQVQSRRNIFKGALT